MDQKLQEFFDKNEAIEREAFLKEKNSVLIKCGLYSTERQYSDKHEWNYKYDPETKNYYKETKVPLDVTDDEYSKILEIYSRGQAAETEKKKEEEVILLESVNPNAERILNFIIVLRLIFCILFSIAFVVAGIVLNDQFDTVAPLPIVAGFVLALLNLTLNLVFWALQKVVINISNNLHNISRLTNRIEKDCPK